MGSVIGIGACVMDTLFSIPYYPPEDTKLRALSSKQAGGGPAATGIVAAAKLGVSTAFMGNLSADSVGDFLVKDFEKYGVDTSYIKRLDGYRAFTSVIWLAKDSRTCVFDKGDLPPFRLSERDERAIASASLLMVDGNDMEAALEASRIARENNVPVLYDCGGLYEGVERLLALTDIMIPSQEFALGHTGKSDPEDAARELYERYSPKIVVVTQGKRGGFLYDGKTVTYYPIYPAEVVDSNGSGDVFHGAFAAGIIRGYDFEKCCHFASAVSALKCMGIGARESVPDFETVKTYMKENGYEL
ncbi:MAG: hypothetical protein IJP16_00195 [Clostridia bacterium]|nr:hypothetical protein [Clostridia bacterium]